MTCRSNESTGRCKCLVWCEQMDLKIHGSASVSTCFQTRSESSNVLIGERKRLRSQALQTAWYVRRRDAWAGAVLRAKTSSSRAAKLRARWFGRAASKAAERFALFPWKATGKSALTWAGDTACWGPAAKMASICHWRTPFSCRTEDFKATSETLRTPWRSNVLARSPCPDALKASHKPSMGYLKENIAHSWTWMDQVMSCELHMPLKCKGDVDSHRIIPTSGKTFKWRWSQKPFSKSKKN